MKKLAFALMCFASVAFFASCTKPVENPEPSIAVMTGDNYVIGTTASPTIISTDDENAPNLKFGFHVESNAQTKKELATLKLNYEMTSTQGTFLHDTTIDLTGKTSYDYIEYLFTPEDRDIVAEASITALVTDADGKTNSATIAFKLDMPEQILEPYDFIWNRHGAAAVTGGIEEVGLQWTNNGKEDFAILKPLEGATLCGFSTDKWEAVTTEAEKAALFSEAISMSDFRGVSAWSTKDYDYVIGTSYNGQYYLIHITRGEVYTFKGTDVTILGQIK